MTRSTAQDLSGRQFGRLTVIQRLPNRGRNTQWACVCECGARTNVLGFCLLNGNTKSCGRHKNRPITHGRSGTKAYVAWGHMLQRCENPRCEAFKDYGARGITVDPEWYSFEAFLRDLGEPRSGMTLERVDNSIGYKKGNCRWATQKEQMNNTRMNRWLEHDGEKHTLAQWREQIGFKRGVIEGRLRKGWSIGAALTTPVQDRIENLRGHR